MGNLCFFNLDSLTQRWSPANNQNKNLYRISTPTEQLVFGIHFFHKNWKNMFILPFFQWLKQFWRDKIDICKWKHWLHLLMSIYRSMVIRRADLILHISDTLMFICGSLSLDNGCIFLLMICPQTLFIVAPAASTILGKVLSFFTECIVVLPYRHT